MPSVKEVLKMAKAKLMESSDLADGRFHIATQLGLEVLERHADGLEEVAVHEFRSWLVAISNNMGRTEYEQLLEQASAADIVADMEADTERLEDDTEARRKKREALLAVARELGSVGARVLVAALFV